MSIIIRNGFRFANPLAALCIVAALCAAQIVAAEPADIQAGSLQEKGGEVTGPDGHDATRIHALKKKIVLAQFDVANTQHVDDISNIYDGLPLTLSSRLEASGEFLSVYDGRSIPAEAGEPQREAIVQIAEETGAQFLISGRVVNAGISQEKGYLGTSIGGYKKRHIEVEFAVYDGLTGASLLLRRLDEQARGEVMVGNNKPFGSSIFLETELGQALNRLLDLAVKDIRTALENVPFAARIIRVEEKKVFLDAGSDSLLKPGDKLVAYARDASNPVAGLRGSVLGVMDRAVDTVTLIRVQPKFSIGELPEEAAKLGINVGGIARIDPAEFNNLTAKRIEASQIAKAQQEARDEAERVKAQQAAQAEAARVEAEQAAKAEAARIKAEKKAAAKAKAQAAAEAKAAKLKARQEVMAARIKAAQEARARAQAREKARAATEAKAAKLKARQEDQQKAKAEALRIKAEKKAEAAKGTETVEAGAAKEIKAAEAGTAKTEPEATADAETAPAKPKSGTPLKLKQIKP